MEEQLENIGEVDINQQPDVKSSQEFNLPTKVSIWTKIKNFLCQEIKVELTPKQQKVEDEINEFLHQEVTWGKVHDFLFQEITFGKK